MNYTRKNKYIGRQYVIKLSTVNFTVHTSQVDNILILLINITRLQNTTIRLMIILEIIDNEHNLAQYNCPADIYL